MRRVVSVWFPTLPTDRLGQPEQSRGASPPVITATNRIVVSANQAATDLGLQPEMKVAQAQALVPGLQVCDADPAADTALLHRLAQMCLRYAPLAAVDLPDGLWIDVTGSTHLHGGEARLLRDLVARLERQGLTTRAAVADTPAVAHAAARFGPGGIVPSGSGMTGAFPVEALRLPTGVVANLRLMGFERVDQVAATARAPLVRRLGAVVAVRLDQAAGVLFEPIVPVTPDASIQVRRTFVEPLLTAEAFSTVIATLVAEACDELEKAGLGARKLDLRFERVDGTLQAIRIGTARPVRDARHLGRMLDERLERVDPGLGVEAMHLIVVAADQLGFVQAASSLLHQAAPDIAPLLDRLANRLGADAIYRIAPTQSDVPERSVRLMPALAPSGVHPSGRAEGWPSDLPRPVRLLNPPQSIEAMALLPDHPPVAFTWRRVRHRVRHADGPERIAGEWWKRDREWLSVRDYFRVEDDSGRRFWVFRRGNGSDPETGDMRWFLHGLF
jgi:protein ImuB